MGGRSTLLLMMGLAFSTMVMAACGGNAETGPEHRTTPAPRSPLETARAHELGRGVPRDYRAAAAAYRAACDEGLGELAACGALIRTQLRDRGAVLDRRAVQIFATKICVQRRDPFSCVASEMLTERQRSDPENEAARVSMDVISHMQPCDAAHMSECYATMLAGALDFSDSSAAQERKRNFKRQLCQLDIIEGCLEIVNDGLPPAEPGEDTPDAEQRLQVACDAGDADACTEAPDRAAIPLRVLCAASDYGACVTLGCLGDPASAKVAADHGATAYCEGSLGRPPRSVRAVSDHLRREEMHEHVDKVCACSDIACLERLQSAGVGENRQRTLQDLDMKVWADGPSAMPASTAKPSSETWKQLERRLQACITKLLSP